MSKMVITTPGQLLDEVEKILQSYHRECVDSVKRNAHMNELRPNEKIDRRHAEAVLVDFMNTIGAYYGVDYGMRTADLK
jgi:hypothetical protein